MMRSGKPAFRRTCVSRNQFEKTSLQQRLELHAEYLNQNDRSGKEKHPFPVGKLCDGLLPDVLIFHDALQVQGIHSQMKRGHVSISDGQTLDDQAIASSHSRNATHGQLNGLQGRETCLAIPVEDIEPIE